AFGTAYAPKATFSSHPECTTATVQPIVRWSPWGVRLLGKRFEVGLVPQMASRLTLRDLNADESTELGEQMRRCTEIFTTITAMLVCVLGAAGSAVAGVSSLPTDTAVPASGGEYSVAIGGVELRSLVINYSGRPPWAACGASSDKMKRVSTYRRAAGPQIAAGEAYLRCGNDKWGYRHIANRHGQDWQNVATMIGSNWRDLCDFAIAETLKVPGSVTYNQDDNTWLYIAPLEIKNSRGEVIRRYQAKVAIGNGKNILTAFFSR
ncbi:MAG: hypothetical protein ACRDQ7_25550, partial [Haloechinothrix sp.]